MKHIILSLSLVLFFAAGLLAQNGDYNWGIGVHPSTFSFSALEDGGSIIEGQEYEHGVQFNLMRHIVAGFDAGAESSWGVVRYPNFAADSLFRRNTYWDAAVVGRYRLDNGYILKKKSFLSPFVKAGFGFNKSKLQDDIGLFVPMGVGLGVHLGRRATAVAQTSFNLGLGNLDRNFLHHSVGLVYNFGPSGRSSSSMRKGPDSDGDNILDEVDVCPDIPGDATAKGCPDRDKDGVADVDDRCPDEFGYSNLMGCNDRDNDGIVDPQDKCPTVFGVAAREGCPDDAVAVVEIIDTDGDGIIDSRDACPTVKGSVVAKGCPDRDGDGILDTEDACPTRYGYSQYNGCPMSKADMDRVTVGSRPAPRPAPIYTPAPSVDYSFCDNVGQELNAIGRDLLFDTDKATLRPESKQRLNRVVEVLRKCEGYSLAVSAHTDSQGSEAYNQRLSERRAQSVRRYLAKKGININRITYNAYGETRPISDNETEEGRQRNRRVEFDLAR